MSRLDRDDLADQILETGLLPEMQDDVAALGVKSRRLTEVYGLAVLKLISACLPLVARIIDGWDRLPADALTRGAFAWHSGDNRLLVRRSADHDLTAIAMFAPDRPYDGLVLLLETDGVMATSALAAPTGSDIVQWIAVRRLTFDTGAISGAIESGTRPDPVRALDRLFQRSRADLLQSADADLRFAIDLSDRSPRHGQRDAAEARAHDRITAVLESSVIEIAPGELDDLLHFLRWIPKYLARANDDLSAS